MIASVDKNAADVRPTFTFSWLAILDAVYMVQVFASNKTLLLRFGLSFTWQQRAGAPETSNYWNRIPGCNLLKPQPSFWLCKLANHKACESGDYTNANASASQCISQYPLLKLWFNTHSAPKASLIWQHTIEANSSFSRIILEVKLWLNFFNLWLLGLAAPGTKQF